MIVKLSFPNNYDTRKFEQDFGNFIEQVDKNYRSGILPGNKLYILGEVFVYKMKPEFTNTKLLIDYLQEENIDYLIFGENFYTANNLKDNVGKFQSNIYTIFAVMIMLFLNFHIGLFLTLVFPVITVFSILYNMYNHEFSFSTNADIYEYDQDGKLRIQILNNDYIIVNKDKYGL